MYKNKLKENFIEKSIIKHGYFYDYSLVVYKNNRTKVKIICPIHGIFEQNPGSHTNGSSCPSCKGGVKLTNDDFLDKANKIHNNKYEYPDIYINSFTKIRIICPIHGVFDQTPNSLISGHGCPECSNVKAYTTDSFKKQANKVHNNKYEYPDIYINSSTKIRIICPIHGVFEQTPNNHISKQHQCPKCSINFKNRSKKIHDDFFIYPNEYIDAKTKIKIICPIHGAFYQLPHSHMSGAGCPICRLSKGEKKITDYLINRNISFEQQKRFIDCKNILPLPFDFYLSEYNLIIEYDGQQHFKSIKRFGGEEKFKQTQKHDKIKNQYCLDNNINLLRIKYNENIEKKLKRYIKKPIV